MRFKRSLGLSQRKRAMQRGSGGSKSSTSDSSAFKQTSTQSLYAFNNIQIISAMGIGIVPPPPQAVKKSIGDEPTSYGHSPQATGTFLL